MRRKYGFLTKRHAIREIYYKKTANIDEVCTSYLYNYIDNVLISGNQP